VTGEEHGRLATPCPKCGQKAVLPQGVECHVCVPAPMLTAFFRRLEQETAED